MASPNEWQDPKNITSIVSSIIGVAGFLFGICSYRWNRHESRLDALGKILDPMIRAAQHLHQANNIREQTERMKLAFPKADEAKEAALRISENIDSYNEHISGSATQFRNAEAEFGSRSFRFPDNIVALISAAKTSLSEYGKLVNNGDFNKADVQQAVFLDDFRKIKRLARGWRLADPFEWLRLRLFPKREAPPKRTEFDLDDKEMEEILSLVYKRGTSQSQNKFAVHPPKKLIEHPEIQNSENVIDELKDSIFVVVFQDGQSKMFGLVELMAFTYLLILLQKEYQNAAEMMRASSSPADVRFNVSFNLSPKEMMRTETVKVLLSKIEFSEVASDS